MSQPMPDDENLAAPRGDNSQGSCMYSTQTYSQQFPFPLNQNDPQYAHERLSQLEDDSDPMDVGSLVEHRLDEPPTTTANANTGVSNVELGNLIAKPNIVDPQKEVIDNFSFAQHDLRKSSQQRRPGQEMGSTTTAVGGNGPSNAQVSTQRVSLHHPRLSPVLSRHSSTKKSSPVQTSETVRPIPARSSSPTQHNEDTDIQEKQGDNQEHRITYYQQSPEKVPLPEKPHSDGSDGTEDRDEVTQPADEERREPRDGYPSTGLQPSTAKQHERQSESMNTSSSWTSFKQLPRGPERHNSVITGNLDSIRVPEDLVKQSSSEFGNENAIDSSPTLSKGKTRQPRDDGKSNMRSKVQAGTASRVSHDRPLEPSRNGANLHVGRRNPEVTKPEGPRDLTFSPKKQVTPRRQHKPIDQVFRQAPQVRPGRRDPATPMTRPMRTEPPKNHPCRPLSSNSNVSKRRAPQPPKMLPIEHAGVGEMLNNDFRGLTHQWNSYFNRLEEYKDGVETELKTLRERVATQDEDIEEYKREIHRQSQVIGQTTAERDEWAAQAEEERHNAEKESSKMQNLHGKCKEFRNQLNAATEEHQSLYRRNKETILALKKEQETRSARIQQENEELRAGIKTRVIETSKKAQEQVTKRTCFNPV